MQELQAYRRMLGDIGDRTIIASHKKDKNRTHTLPGTLTNMIKSLLQQSVLMLKTMVEHSDKIGQFGSYRLPYNRQIIHVIL